MVLQTRDTSHIKDYRDVEYSNINDVLSKMDCTISSPTVLATLVNQASQFQ